MSSEYRSYLKEAADDFSGGDFSEALLKCEDLMKEDTTPVAVKIEAMLLSVKALIRLGRTTEAFERYLASPPHSWNPSTEHVIIDLYDQIFNKAVHFYEIGDYRMSRIFMEVCRKKCRAVFAKFPIVKKGKLVDLENLRQLIQLKMK